VSVKGGSVLYKDDVVSRTIKISMRREKRGRGSIHTYIGNLGIGRTRLDVIKMDSSRMSKRRQSHSIPPPSRRQVIHVGTLFPKR